MDKLDESLNRLLENFLVAINDKDKEQMASILDAFTQGVLLGYQIGKKGGDADA